MLLQVFKSVMLVSLVGSGLFLILLALKPITKRVFGSKWEYYIWLTVFIVMMLPISIKMPVSKKSETLGPAAAQVTQTRPIQEPVTQDPIAAPDTPEVMPETPKQKTFTDFLNNITVGMYDLMAYVWLGGAVLFFFGGVISYLMFLTTLRKNSVPISCPELSQVLVEKGMKNRVFARATNCINAPLMVGVLKPTLLLPDVSLSETDLRYILLHELTHLKRHDLWYKWFTMLVNAVHWFNPLVYFAVRQINEECEISCDLAAIGHLNKFDKKAYMNTILMLLSENKPKDRRLTTMAVEPYQIPVDEKKGG